MKLSGQKAVAVAGTSVQLGTGPIGGPLAVKALKANTNLIFIGHADGAKVSSTTGYQLDAKEAVVFEFVEKLEDIWLDAVVGGEGVSWLRLRTGF